MALTKDELEYLRDTVIEAINVHAEHWSKHCRKSWNVENARLKNILKRLEEERELLIQPKEIDDED